MHFHSRVHIHVHMLTQAHAAETPPRHAGTWDMQASAHTCFPLILTWLESWLPPGEERKSKEDRTIRVRLLPEGLSIRIVGMGLKLAIVEAESAQTGTR